MALRIFGRNTYERSDRCEVGSIDSEEIDSFLFEKIHKWKSRILILILVNSFKYGALTEGFNFTMNISPFFCMRNIAELENRMESMISFEDLYEPELSTSAASSATVNSSTFFLKKMSISLFTSMPDIDMIDDNLKSLNQSC